MWIRRKLALVVLVVFAFGGSDALAQRRPAVPARPQARGVVKSVDSGAGTITVTTATRGEQGTDRAYTLAKTAEVAVGSGSRRGIFKEAKLADLAVGTSVALVLAADGKTVEAVLAESPVVRGVLKSVDVKEGKLTVALRASRRGEAEEEKSFSVASGAEVGVDDGQGRRFSVKEARLADLPPGSLVTLSLTVDQNKVEGIVAEGPTLLGTVKAVDLEKKTLTLTNRTRGGEAEEKTVQVAPNVVVLLDDGKGRRFSLRQGKLASIPPGAVVNVRLSVDQKQATLIRAEGPSLPARLKSVDAKKGTITVETRVARGENPEEKTFTLARDVQVLIDGRPAKVTDLKAGEEDSFTMLRLSLDQKTVQAIQVGRPRGRE
jgi:hypothetical protein